MIKVELKTLDLGWIQERIDKIVKDKEYAKAESLRLFKRIGEGVDYEDSLAVLEGLILGDVLFDVKQSIKQACEFWLRYKDNPKLLVKEHEEYTARVVSICGNNPNTQKIYGYLEYSEWLFKLTFKDVLEDEGD